MRIISEVVPKTAPFIPCANYATAKYYQGSDDDSDIWVTRYDPDDCYVAPYYVVLTN